MVRSSTPHATIPDKRYWRVLRGKARWLRSRFQIIVALGLILAGFSLTPVAYAATITVNTTSDEVSNNGNCSLREAIRAANTDAAVDACAAGSNSAVDTIALPAGTFLLTIAGNDDLGLVGDLDITGSVTIDGLGASATVIDGNSSDRIFDVYPSAATSFTISDVTIRNGDVRAAPLKQGGAIWLNNNVTTSISNSKIINNKAEAGGAILNNGALTIVDSELSGNQAVIPSGIASSGGGILSNGPLTLDSTTIANNFVHGAGGGIAVTVASSQVVSITRSTIAGNTASSSVGTNGKGGGISTIGNTGTINITNSTISGNSADIDGGGMYFATPSSGNATLNNVTIHDNTANNDGDSAGDGGGVFQHSGNVNVKNTLIAGNSDNGGTGTHPDISGTFTNQGNNLIGKQDGSSSFPTGPLVGSIAAPIDHQLAGLAHNGGSTHTHALSESSPAIDAGNPASCASHDQRGIARTVGAACDIGAYEAGDQTAPKITLTLDPSDTLAASGWYNAASSGTNGIAVSVAVTDRSGVTSVTCTDGSTTVLNTSASSGSFTLNNGTHSISCTATDAASPANSGAGSGSTAMPATYKIDSVAPTIGRNTGADSCSVAGSAGWCRGTQTAGFTASDATSNLANAAQASFTQSTSTNGSAVMLASGSVCDVAGNCVASINAGPFKIDSVAPTLSPTVTPNPAPYQGSATASANATDSLSTVATSSCDPVDTSSLGLHTVACSATDVAGNSATASATYDVQILDSTPPVITSDVVGTLGNNGWYVSNVTVSWTVSDPDSAISSPSGCDSTTISADTASTTLTCTATSAGGTSSSSVTIKRDATAPALAPTVVPNPVLLNGTATASANASDSLSGLASSSCGTVNTSSVGTKSVLCTATDKAGNTASASASYNVIYKFSGFFQPVDNLPVFNSVKAGSGVPIKFSLSGNQGLNIFASGYPVSQKITCASNSPVDAVEETATSGSSSLSYNAATDRYTYIWKTDKAWANSCRQLIVKLIDGTEYRANFKLTK